VPRVIIHHLPNFDSCYDNATCGAAVDVIRKIDIEHGRRIDQSDIGFNFLVGENGVTYTGRGWNVIGGHAINYNRVSIGIGIIGEFKTMLPNSVALDAAKALIAYGVQIGKISANYALQGHRNVSYIPCPGLALFSDVLTWPHYP
jgi:N-acetylmuramoyl-L-alanine amidase